MDKTRFTEGFTRTGEVEPWSNFANQPFSKAPRLDLDYIVSLLQTRRQALEDHLVDLQTDPAYLRQYIKMNKPGAHMKPEFKKGIQQAIGDLVFGDLDLYVDMIWLEKECQQLQQLVLKHCHCFHRQHKMPSSMRDACNRFENLLRGLFVFQAQQFKLASWYHSDDSTSDLTKYSCEGGKQLVHVHMNEWPEQVFLNKRILWCIGSLNNELFDGIRYRNEEVLAILEDYRSSCSRKERASLSQTAINAISMLAMMCEITTALELHRPRWESSESATSIDEQGSPLWARKVKTAQMLAPSNSTAVSHGEKLMSEFYSRKPPSGPKNKLKVDEMKRQSQAIGKFWSGMRQVATRRWRDLGFSEDLRTQSIKVASATLDIGYIQRVTGEENAILCRYQAELGDNYTVFNDFANPGGGPKLQPIPRRAKTKTRPEISGDDDVPIEESKSEKISAETQPVTQAVPKRALIVLHLMFPNDPDEAGRFVGWNELVLAMRDAGFVARNNGGSAVRFEMKQDTQQANLPEYGQKGAIVIHRPHPVPKIYIAVLRSIGNRMNKWFGWVDP